MSFMRSSLRYSRPYRPRCLFQWSTPNHPILAPIVCRTINTIPPKQEDASGGVDGDVPVMTERQLKQKRRDLEQEEFNKNMVDLSAFGITNIVPSDIKYVRAVPLSPSYFSRQSHFNESFLKLQNLLRTNRHLPALRQQDVRKVAWKSISDYNRGVGEELSLPLYNQAIEMAKRLYRIAPERRPAEVDQALNDFMRPMNPFGKGRNEVVVDKFGRALGVGRRKTSTARAWVVEGTGEVQVNGKSLCDAFGRVHDRESATWPLRVTERMDKYNVWALVEGGGTTGQAEALTLAMAKALAVHEPGLRNSLRKAGCLTRDPRSVERKKPGHVKARKMPAWVKR